MLEVTASQFIKHFGEYKEKVQRQPIAITSNGRTSGYFVSQHEYDEYVKLKTQSRQVYGLCLIKYIQVKFKVKWV